MLEKCFCCCGLVRELFSDKIVSLNKCSSCGTIIAKYSGSLKVATTDYYKNDFFSNTASINSLLRTRSRQAELINSKIINHANKDELFIDFGSGYGVFIQLLAKKGYFNLEAVENSEIAVSKLKKYAKAFLINDRTDLLSYLESKVKIDFFSALDVLEHFKPNELNQLLEYLSKDTVNINKLIIKVPSCNGLLFIAAFWLAKFNISKALLYKMLQVNAPPPHYVYFSRKGLMSLLLKHGYDLSMTIYDSDYELAEFGQRVSSNTILVLLINAFAISFLACANFFFPESRESIITLYKNNRFKQISG